MTKPARAEDDVKKIKNVILENALQIIIKDGYSSFTMRGVAKKSKMSATNLYNYFSNKDEIYISLVIRGFQKLYDSLNSVYISNLDLTSKAKKMIEEYLEFGFNHAHYYDIMFTTKTPKYNDYVDTPFEKLAAIEMELSMKIKKIVEELVGELLPEKNIKTVKNMQIKVVEIWSMLHGIITFYNNGLINYVVSNPKSFYKSVVKDIFTFFEIK